MRHVRIVSRAGKLALAQADIVRNLLKKQFSDVELNIVTVSTRGDRDKSDFLYKADSVGLFTSEVENALLEGSADIAVHSLKDLPTAGSTELTIAAILKRECAADVLIASSGAASIEQLPAGAAVGTSSLRRIAQLKHTRSDLNCVPLRGNVETRVRKVTSGRLDAAIVAYAGIVRLGLQGSISAVLSPEQFLTAPGQGALAVQVRTKDSELVELVSALDDQPTRIAVEAERFVLAAMHGGCSIPLGVYAKVTNDEICIDAMIADVDGGSFIRRSVAGPASSYERLANNLAAELLRAGGEDILKQIRNTHGDPCL